MALELISRQEIRIVKQLKSIAKALKAGPPDYASNLDGIAKQLEAINETLKKRTEGSLAGKSERA